MHLNHFYFERKSVGILFVFLFPERIGLSGEGILVINDLHLSIKQGDITEEDVGAIVNSTNETLDLSKGMLKKSW